MRRTVLVATFASAALALSSCGGGDAQPEPTSSASASASSDVEGNSTTDEDGSAGSAYTVQGQDVSGPDFSLQLPPDWNDATDQFQANLAVAVFGALDSEVNGQFSDNVNVIKFDGLDNVSLDEAAKQSRKELATVATRVKELARTDLGGEEAVQLVGLTRVGKANVRTLQVSAFRGESYYLITFSHGPQSPDKQRQADIDTVVSSWQWAN